MIETTITTPYAVHIGPLFIIWLIAIIIALSIDLGYRVYKNIKRKFDITYNAEKVLPKRIIHGIVYIIFLVIAYDAVEIRVKGDIATVVLFIVYLFFLIIAIFIFGDIIISLNKILRHKK